MNCDEMIFSAHAVTRMFERRLNADDIRHAVQHGKIIATYPDDKPFPSVLILDFIRHRPLHVVVGKDDASGTCYVVTAYEPSEALWNSDFQTRKPS